MVLKFFPNLKNSSKGITIVEIAVVVFIIMLFTTILIANFPKILRQMALSKATYKLEQDLRKTEDLALSGVKVKDKNGCPVPVKNGSGYGIYIPSVPTTQYAIYADVTGDYKYTNGPVYPKCTDVSYYSDSACTQKQPSNQADCVTDIIDIAGENPGAGLSITNLQNVASPTSINFIPPNPKIIIDNLSGSSSTIGISLKNSDSSTITVQVSTSGLISVQ
jgi:hypothetical protein